MRRQEQHVCEMVRPTTVKRMVWCTVFYVRGVKECACLRKPHFSSDSYLDRRKRTLIIINIIIIIFIIIIIIILYHIYIYIFSKDCPVVRVD